MCETSSATSGSPLDSSNVQYAVAKKAMDSEKAAGEAAVQLIEAASKSFDQRLSSARASTSGAGLDTYA